MAFQPSASAPHDLHQLSVFGGTEVRSGAQAVTYVVANALVEPHLFMQPGVKPANAGQLSRLASCRPAAVGGGCTYVAFRPDILLIVLS
jgi:hypothetical protein